MKCIYFDKECIISIYGSCAECYSDSFYDFPELKSSAEDEKINEVK